MNPILLDIPDSITTKRLLIRPPMPGDGPEFCNAVNESFVELNKWMSWASVRPTVESSEANIRESYASWIRREVLRLSLFDKKSMRLLGSSGFHAIDWKSKRFEIGYWGRTPDNGQGYITEAVTALTQFAFSELGARRVEIHTDSENVLSLKIPKKLGFTLEATLQNHSVQLHTGNQGHTLIFARFDAKGLPDVDARWGQYLFENKAILGIHHVQITIPKGQEAQAKDFYCKLLGIAEIEKPENLKTRGGFWMNLGSIQVHVGAEDQIDRHKTKAHIAYAVKDLNHWKSRLESAGVLIEDGMPIPGFQRFEFRDPFGNRIEFIEQTH